MKITIDIPDEIAQNSTLSQADWLREIAISLFRQELITLGTASHIARTQQLEFQGLLYDRGISLHYDIDDYRADIESLRSNHWR
jgi:predicted HTH domain antitoxin